MKIIYNTEWLHNLQVRNKVRKWAKLELITKEEESAILAAHNTGFYMPSFWVALGLFFFTVVLLFAAGGFISLLFASAASSSGNSEVVFQVLFFVYSAVCLFAGEHYKKEKHYLNAGTDNVLIWMGLGLLIGSFGWIFFETGIGDTKALILIWLVGTLVCTLATLRYADPFLSLAAFVHSCLFLCMASSELSELTKALLPFILFVNAAVLYIYIKKKAKQKGGRFHQECLKMIEVATLLLGYISVNYFVVREASVEMFDHYYAEGEEIPYAFVFYFFTVVLPPAYVYFGLKQKDRLLFRIGLLLIVATILTIRHYHSVLPVEVAFTIGGALLIGLSYGLIRWLQTPRNGFTFKAQDETNLAIAESLLVVQSFAKGNAPSNDGANFGGGDFGGAGASHTY